MATGRTFFGDAETTPAERRLIREQLDRILVHSHFRNSRRYPVLLQYTVEKVLAGEAESLKERTLGVDVFGRAAGYDTNLDHIVRSTAAEVRKRLAQYYQEPEHEGQIRIDLPSGSYVPQFRRPPAAPPTERVPEMLVERPSGWRTFIRPRSRVWVSLSAALGVASVAIYLVSRGTSNGSQAALDRFWAPVCYPPGAVALYVPDPSKSWAAPPAGGVANPPFDAFESLGSEQPVTPDYPGALNGVPVAIQTLIERNVPFADAVTLNRLGTIFALRGKEQHVVYCRDSTLWDLRRGSAVLVGGVDNFWSVKLTGELRFRFLVDRSAGVATFVIGDRKSGTVWRSSGDPIQSQGVDYAIIARIEHPSTGRLVVVAGGIQEYGTLAAGEFLTNGNALAELERLRPRDTKGTNVQAVLSTSVLKRTPAPPKIVAAYFW
jgi:hypothetical protein